MASCLDTFWHLVSPAQSFTIAGRQYTVVSRLGEGGYAVVELVQAANDGRRFALKRIQLGSHDARMLAELELTMLRKLDHPSIVHLHGSTRAHSSSGNGDELLLLLDYYPRGSLQQHIEQTRASGTRSSALWIMRVFVNICEAVEQIHSLDPPMAHRDLKPDNVMLGQDAQIALIDFGSAVVARRRIDDRIALQSTIEESERRCTPSYRPPELWDRGMDEPVELDERIDIWALGCLLYAMMFGENPFDLVALNGGNLKLAIIDANFQFPTNQTYPEDMCALVRFMLNRHESERPSISEVLEKVRDLAKRV